MFQFLVSILLFLCLVGMLSNLTLATKLMRRPHLHTMFNISAALLFLLMGVTLPFIGFQYFKVLGRVQKD